MRNSGIIARQRQQQLTGTSYLEAKERALQKEHIPSETEPIIVKAPTLLDKIKKKLNKDTK